MMSSLCYTRAGVSNIKPGSQNHLSKIRFDIPTLESGNSRCSVPAIFPPPMLSCCILYRYCVGSLCVFKAALTHGCPVVSGTGVLAVCDVE